VPTNQIVSKFEISTLLLDRPQQRGSIKYSESKAHMHAARGSRHASDDATAGRPHMHACETTVTDELGSLQLIILSSRYVRTVNQ
jgi:hypothetical protein